MVASTGYRLEQVQTQGELVLVLQAVLPSPQPGHARCTFMLQLYRLLIGADDGGSREHATAASSAAAIGAAADTPATAAGTSAAAAATGAAQLELQHQVRFSLPLPFVQLDTMTWLHPHAHASAPQSHAEPGTVELLFSSLAYPPSVLRVQLGTGSIQLLRPASSPLHTTASESYCHKQVWPTSTDGAQVPISLVYKVDSSGPKSAAGGPAPASSFGPGPRPVLLYVYGAYGVREDLQFKAWRMSLLERGWVVAVAHVRGGGYLGCSWHHEGRLERRSRGRQDLVACCLHLLKGGYTSQGGLCVETGSAGE